MPTHDLLQVRDTVMEYLKKAGVVLRRDEVDHIEVTDFGLGHLSELGLQLVTYVNTQRCCAKELVLLPWQVCPEHLHPPVGDYPGKEETFRCRSGIVWLYVPGEPTISPHARLPKGYGSKVSVRHETELRPGDQWTIPPNTLHWFQAGPEGAVVSEFSTMSLDEHDVFTDPDVKRLERVVQW